MTDPLILIHTLASAEDVQNLLNTAPAGAYRIRLKGEAVLEKIEPDLPKISNDWKFVSSDSVSFSITAPKGVTFKVYDSPSLKARVLGSFSDGRTMTVIGISLDGWLCVYRSKSKNIEKVVEMWLPPLSLSYGG